MDPAGGDTFSTGAVHPACTLICYRRAAHLNLLTTNNPK